MRIARGVWVAAGVALLQAACGSSDSKDEAARLTAGPGSSANGGFAPVAGSAAATPTTSTGSPGTSIPPGGSQAPVVADLPPEMEATFDLQLPQASEHYVYSPNPKAGTVAVIDAETQAIQAIKTGNQPTYLRTIAGTDNAIVLNVGSNKASILRHDGDAVNKTDLPVSAGANAIAVSPNGKHAIVYYNSTYQSAGQTVGSYQDVAVLTLADDAGGDKTVSMTVGFRPRDVFFSDDGARGFVITEDGVSVLDFADIEKSGPGIARLVTFGGSVDQKNLDVSVTSDGHHALARAEGQPGLHWVDLDNGELRTLDLSAVFAGLNPGVPAVPATGDDAGIAGPPVIDVTDLDLMPDASAALAVIRSHSTVLRIPLPGAFEGPNQVTQIPVPGQVIGSLTIGPDGAYALGYTTALDLERMIILDLKKQNEPRVVALRKSVDAVAFTPDGKTALVTHKKAPGAPTDPGLTPDQVIDRSFGYSLLRVATGDVKLQATNTQLGPIAMVPDGSFLFILFRDDATKVKEVQRVALSSFLVDPIIQLENPPVSIGTANASGTVFVNLEHPDGRMTFIDWQEPLEKLKTVTGFELNSRIRD